MRITHLILLALMVFSVASCKKTLTANDLPAHIVIGDTYYTQFVIRYEKGTHLTTNFRRGASISVNTPVRLVDITEKTIEVAVENAHQNLLVKNAVKHTGDNIYQAFDKLFAKNKVNLAQFTPLEREQINNGNVVKGMRKKAVTVAIGYPPTTETMNLNSNKWVYWSGRFNRFNVHFNGDTVSNVED